MKRKEREIGEKVDVERVQKMKKRLEGELKEKRKALKLSLKASIAEEKDKYFKKSNEDVKEKGRNKKRKEKLKEKKGTEEEAEEAQEEEGAEQKKRKRMALYGI